MESLAIDQRFSETGQESTCQRNEKSLHHSRDCDPPPALTMRNGASEVFRRKARFVQALNERTTQLELFALLLAQGSPAASDCARAARAHGATEYELCSAIELVAEVAALAPLERGAAIIMATRPTEER